MNDSLKLIRQLVEDFKQQEAAYLSPNYQEPQVRQDFIDKFFTALGWDVTHERQKNPYEQEVKIENRVKMSGSQRYADYAFFIAPNFRDVKFYVEAKKPSRNLANLDDYYQTIRYGWNSNTPIAVLTDFEEFHILDCRYKPDRDTALDRQIEVLHYADYANEETFARIFYLFGREAVANGSLEKRAAELPKPRGKAIQKGLFKGGYQQVDEAFLVALDGYRDTLAHTFKAKNPDLGGEELTEAVQRTIDRLVFIRFLEDKQIEDTTIVGFRSKPSAWRAFVAYCKSLEPKYNGLIFKPHRILDGDDFIPPDDEKFADICTQLSDRESPYDFDKIPISILGSIYERFLGKVVSATEKRVKVIEKPEVRKAGGVYYTPEYIVRYIVKETVGKMIEGKSPDQITKMAFVDIACGSGSFLLEVYDTLLEYHRRWYNEHPDKARKSDVEQRDGKLALTLKKRQEILTNNVYGVDIDFQATEVTQLSLYLKLLEDVTLTQLHLFKEKVLPNLSRNIICGNSLIEPDIETQASLFESNAPSPRKAQSEPRGGTVDDSTRRGRGPTMDALKPMRFTDAFPDVMARGGFDAIVGNPPYVLGRETFDERSKQYLSHHYKSFGGKYDLYIYFSERAISLVKHNGMVSYILPNTLLANENATLLRKLILDSTRIKIIRTFEAMVFKKAQVESTVIVLQKGQMVGENEIDIVRETLQQQIPQTTFTGLTNFKFNVNQDKSTDSLLDKISKTSTSLGGISDICIGIQLGGSSGKNKKSSFLASRSLDKTHKPVLDGKNINTYELKWDGIYVRYGKWLHRKREEKYFLNPKILVRQIGSTPIATYDDKFFYTLNTIYNVLITDERVSTKYVLAIMNSSLGKWYWLKENSDFKSLFPKIKKEQLARLPIRTINFTDTSDKARHDRIVNLVEQMLAAKEKLANTKTDAEVTRLEMQCESLDRQIDAAVYELYGLTEEEIKIVEGHP